MGGRRRWWQQRMRRRRKRRVKRTMDDGVRVEKGKKLVQEGLIAASDRQDSKCPSRVGSGHSVVGSAVAGVKCYALSPKR